tara:strand:- start:478 stop:1215 length:738 start_codon:yes stop_codon:yes gene_type:complete
MNFNQYSKYYDLFYKNKKYSKEISNIKKLVKLNKQEKVLEIGCGTGNHSFELSKHCGQVLALDKSLEMIKIAKKKYSKKNITFKQLEILDISENNKYDKIILLFHVFSYFTNKTYIRKIANKLKLITKPGGYIIFDFWNSEYTKKNELNNNIREIKYKNTKIIRESIIKKKKKNVFNVKYNFFIFKKKQKKYLFFEEHIMKSFNKNDIKGYFKKNFTLMKFTNLMNFKDITDKDFSALAIIKKNE